MLAEPINDIEAVAVREADIEDEHVGLKVETPIEGFLESVGQLDLNGIPGEDFGEDTRDFDILLDDKDAGIFAGDAEDAR